MALTVVILAAGKGRRMQSSLPKALRQLAGRSLLEHVYQKAAALEAGAIRIVHNGDGQLRDALGGVDAEWIVQRQQLGTGRALLQALDGIPASDWVLSLYVDMPMIAADTLSRLFETAQKNGHFALLTAVVDEPGGYGRIVRNGAAPVRIVEAADATPGEREIREINAGAMAVRADLLRQCLDSVQKDNQQGEFYLTDIVAVAAQQGVEIDTVQPRSLDEISGANNCAELADMERRYQRAQAQRLMDAGVTLLDPARFDLRGELEIGRDCVFDVNVVLEGRLRFGDRVRVGAHCVIKDTVIEDDAEILPHTVIEGAQIGAACRVGPFARVRPRTVLKEKARLGNFVETKQATLREGVKANHLSYLGDVEIGADTNIGAGTITCNYDGGGKHKTLIGDRVFIGSDVQLVAPVSVCSDATVAAGSVITRDVTEGGLTISRAPQKNVPNWKRPKKT